MKWKKFIYQGKIYSLDHLNSFQHEVIVPAKNQKPARTYLLNVDFSLHCFTRGVKKREIVPEALAYSDKRETRIFDFERYKLSNHLPEIICSLADRRCYHDKHGNFYVVEIVDQSDKAQFYSIFFKLSKAGKRKGLNLYVSSAHGRDDFPYSKNRKPIGFRILVHNINTGKKVKPAP